MFDGDINEDDFYTIEDLLYELMNLEIEIFTKWPSLKSRFGLIKAIRSSEISEDEKCINAWLEVWSMYNNW